jgi:cell division protein FtsI/penicillin-binding protein 2
VEDCVKFSSNICAVKVAMKLGSDNLVQGLRRFGFGEKPGLGLAGMSSGIIQEEYNDRALASLALGQGLTASTLQLGSAMSALANKGIYFEPRLVTSMTRGRDEIVSFMNTNQGNPVVKPEVARSVTKALRGVTEGGTGQKASLGLFAIAGKTGTAQAVVDGRYSPTVRVASFSGYAPASNPIVSVTVVAYNPQKGQKYGGVVAAPTAGAIAHDVLRYLSGSE